jgi:hypothetical protein
LEKDFSFSFFFFSTAQMKKFNAKKIAAQPTRGSTTFFFLFQVWGSKLGEEGSTRKGMGV